MDILQGLHSLLPFSCEEFTICSVVNVFIAIISIRVLYCICRLAYRNFRIRKVRNKKADQTATTKGRLLQKLIGLKTPMENRNSVTALPFHEVRKRLLSNDISAIDVLEAYQARALDVDSKFNCITDVVYDADVTALYLDSFPEEQRASLHGVPLSVQENVKQSDFDSYFGSVSRCFNPETTTATVIEALTEAGMIPFVRTTGSQTDFSLHCKSYLFGETLNSRAPKRICGGSSGGEGTLIGARGSIAGIGVDICGGIRISASFSGNFGFKPTHERVGSRQVAECQFLHRPGGCGVTVGPMSSDLDLLVEMMKVIFSDSFFDLNHRSPRLHFDQECFTSVKPMTIGYYKSFSDPSLSVQSVPAVERAVEEVKSALERRGHTLVEWEPPRIGRGAELFLRALYADGGEASYRLSKVDKIQNTFHWMAGLDCFTKFFMKTVLGLKTPILSEYLKASGSIRSADQVFGLIEDISLYREECDRSWNDANLDALVCPVLPFVSPTSESATEALPGILYSSIFNILDYPAGVIPVSEVSQADVETLRTSHNENLTKDLLQSQMDSVGQSLCVQCVSCSYHDEKVLRLMKEIQSTLN